MTNDRLENYRAFQSLIASLGPAILHDNERAKLLDAAEGLLLSDDPDVAAEMMEQALGQTSRMQDGAREEIIEALRPCGPETISLI